MITKRPRRLSGFSYTGYQRYFVTTCTAFRRPIFAREIVANEVVTELLRNASLFHFAVLAYCLMLDHLHVLIEATSEHATLPPFVKRFKQTTGFAYRQQTRDPLWQPGYHDRILRDDEMTDDVIRYILENPIRAGLTNTLGDYQFAGSPMYSIAELLAAWEKQT